MNNSVWEKVEPPSSEKSNMLYSYQLKDRSARARLDKHSAIIVLTSFDEMLLEKKNNNTPEALRGF